MRPEEILLKFRRITLRKGPKNRKTKAEQLIKKMEGTVLILHDQFFKGLPFKVLWVKRNKDFPTGIYILIQNELYMLSDTDILYQLAV